MQIAGLDSYPVDSPQGAENMVVSHIKAIRRINRFRNAKIVFMPESNLSSSAAMFTKAVVDERIPNVFPLYMSKNPSIPGVYSGAESKHLYVEALQNHLMFESVFFEEDFVAANPIVDSTKFHDYKSKLKTKLFQEIDGFLKIPRLKNYRNAPPAYTGKTNADGKVISGKNDDMVISLMMAAFWSREVTLGKTSLNVARI